MVRRGALERCETGANPLETRGKRKPVTPENDPRETGLSFLNGGGGGSRTPVRSDRTSRFSTLSPDFFSRRRASGSGPPGASTNLERLGPRLQVAGFGPSLVLSTGRRSAPGWLPVPRPRLIKPRERVRCRWQLLFTVVFTGQTACPACSSIARCPVETGSPP